MKDAPQQSRGSERIVVRDKVRTIVASEELLRVLSVEFLPQLVIALTPTGVTYNLGTI